MSFSIRVFFDNRFLTKKVLFFSPPIIRSDFYISKTRDGRIGKEFASSFFVGREAYRELRWLTSFLRPTSESKTKSIGVFSSSWIDSGHTPDGRRRILATYILSRFPFSSLSSQRLFSPKTRARTFKSWSFFFLVVAGHFTFQHRNWLSMDSEEGERSRNQPHLHCSFHVASQKTIETLLFLARRIFSWETKNFVFPEKLVFSLSLSFSCNIVML